MHLRKVFNAYLKGSDTRTSEAELLSQYDKEYFRSKFIVYSIDPFMGGGKLIRIVFQDRPDAIFAAWVYKVGGVSYELRIFEAKVTDKQVMRKMRIRYKKFLQDKFHAL